MSEPSHQKSLHADTPVDGPTVTQPARSPPGQAAPAAVDSHDGSFHLGTAATVSMRVSPQNVSGSEPAVFPAQLNGRYTFRTLLGRGGFGYVYSALDETLQRVVAIKLARKDRFDGTQGRTQFLDEARAAAKLKHEHIVKVFDSGTDEAGNPFVVFEFIDGETLSERIARQPLNGAEVIAIVGAVAEAVHVAHKAGLVHRDLKPSNILLDRSGGPHVTDFGLAVDETSQRLQAGHIAGSWPYMSPEQVRGQTQYLDGRTDIWSLGVILYELLARRRPFSGGTTEEVCDEILHRDPKPPRQIDDAISHDLERICLRCLRKSPADRYSTAADVASDLRKAAGKPGAPRASSWMMAAGSLAVVCLIAGLWWINANSRRIDPLAPDPRGKTASDAAHLLETPSISQNSVNPAAPHAWTDHFGIEPEEIAWPGRRGRRQMSWSSDHRKLTLVSDSPQLVQFGMIDDHQSTMIKIRLERIDRWDAGGIFWDYQELDDGKEISASLQTLRIDSTSEPGEDQGQRRWYLLRTLSQLDPQVGYFQDRGSQRLAIPAPNGYVLDLELEFSMGKLAAIRLEGESFPDLVPTPRLIVPIPGKPVIMGEGDRKAWGGLVRSGTMAYSLTK